jgi:processive 1,2-diacylglycerol beta-glucosyltransferase
MKSKKPRILILTAPVGNGHNAAAKAIRSCLESRYDTEVQIYDIFTTASKFRTWLITKFYFWMAKYFIGILNRLYQDTKMRENQTYPDIFVGGKIKPMIADVIRNFSPDAVVCTHIGCAIASSELKQEKKLQAPVFNIATDYDIPPYIQFCSAVDYFITPSTDFDREFLRHGIKQERILPYGIPTDRKFSVYLDKTEIRRKLGIRKEIFVIVITNGFVGLGNTVKLIKKLFLLLPDKIHIISICGKNIKLKKQIDDLIRQGQTNLLNYGFIDNVCEIMSASDLLIGKLGGLTATEALNKNLCILASTNLPMQEYDNMLYLSSHGACGYIRKPAEVGTMVVEYLERPEILSRMHENIKKISKPNAAVDIANAIMCVMKGTTLTTAQDLAPTLPAQPLAAAVRMMPELI